MREGSINLESKSNHTMVNGKGSVTDVQSVSDMKGKAKAKQKVTTSCTCCGNPNPGSVTKCKHCDNAACPKCIRQCHTCELMFCSLCSIVK